MKVVEIVIRENHSPSRAVCGLCDRYGRALAPFDFFSSDDPPRWICQRCATEHCGIETVHVVSLANTAYLFLRPDVRNDHVIEYLRGEIDEYETAKNIPPEVDEIEGRELDLVDLPF